MTDGGRAHDPSEGTTAGAPVDDVLDALRQRIERIESLELAERVPALEQVNDGLVRTLGELDDL